MAVKVKAYKHGSALVLDLYVVIRRISGGKREGGYSAVLESYPTKVDADAKTGLLRDFNLGTMAIYAEDVHPYVLVYNAYKAEIVSQGYQVEDV